MGLFGPCPLCKGKTIIQNSAGQVQMCPKCDGTGDDPGVEVAEFTYTGQFTLTANQLLPGQIIKMNGIAPFRLKLRTRTSTGAFRCQIYDNTLRYYSGTGVTGGNDYVRDALAFGDGQLPYVMAPHPVIDKNGFIGLNLQDVSGAGNTIEFAFVGSLLAASPALN